MRKSPMKIVILVHVLSVGGAERQFIQLAEGLRRRGHDVRIVALHVSNPGWRWMQRTEGILATALFDQVPEGPLESTRQFISAIRQLRRIFSEHQTQIAHAANTGLMATLLWFSTLGRSLPSTVWGQRGGFGLARPRQRAIHHWLAARFSRAVSHHAAVLVANSEAGGRALQRDGLRCRRFEVVPNGIDVSHFERDDRAGEQLRGHWGFRRTQHVVGWVGRPTPVKDLECFVQAAALVARRDADARFVVVGGHHAGKQLRYKLLARSLGIENRIIWESAREQLVPVYSGIDMLCLSSIAEGFPNVVAESMACGTPCVVTDVGAAAEIVGESGIIVPSDSPELLAKGIEQMTGRLDGVDRRALRDSIESRFTLERHVSAMESIYSDLLDGNS